MPTRRIVSSLLVVAFLATVGAAVPARAQYAPGGPCPGGATTSPPNAQPGETVTLSAGPFFPGTPVTFTVDGVEVGTATANAQGFASLPDVTVPGDDGDTLPVVTVTGTSLNLVDQCQYAAGGRPRLELSPATLGPDGIYRMSSHNALRISAVGCRNGDGTPPPPNLGARVTGLSVPLATGLVETPAGSGIYEGTLPPPSVEGVGTLTITIACPNGGTTVLVVTIQWIDPSGTVRTVEGVPVAGATVTLFRSDERGGPFARVPDGSAIMSPDNRRNPDLTGPDGTFGWDVVAGFYVVRAEKAGCTNPADPSVGFVETPVLEIPPEVTGIDLRLDCPAAVARPPGPTLARTGADRDSLIRAAAALLMVGGYLALWARRRPSTSRGWPPLSSG